MRPRKSAPMIGAGGYHAQHLGLDLCACFAARRYADFDHGDDYQQRKPVEISGPSLSIQVHHDWDMWQAYRLCDFTTAAFCDVSDAFVLGEIHADDDSWFIEFNGHRSELFWQMIGMVGGFVTWTAAPIPYQSPNIRLLEPMQVSGNIWEEDATGFRFLDVSIEAAGTMNLEIGTCYEETPYCGYRDVETMVWRVSGDFSGTATPPVHEPGTMDSITVALALAILPLRSHRIRERWLKSA